MRLKPRRLFKTTVYGIGFILWLWGTIDLGIRIFYTSQNSLLLDEVADSLNRFIGGDKAETFYSSIFGVVKDSLAKNTGDIFNIKGRSGKGFSLVLRTSGGSTQGVHPNLIIADDACGQKDRTSQAERVEKIAWFDTLQPLLVPWYDKKTTMKLETIMYIGTRWHFKDLPNHILEQNEKLPEHLQWDIEVESIYKKNEKPKSNYPEIISDNDIVALKATMSEAFFACQYENVALSDDLIVFDLKKLHFTRPDQIDLNHGQILCVFDPSLGKAESDFPAVWWVHFFNGVTTFIDAIDKKTELGLLVHHIANKNVEYNCRELIYESNGTMLIDKHLKESHGLLNHRIYIHDIYHSSIASKKDRIVSMQPYMYSGVVQFMSDYQVRYPEAMNQIVFYPVYGPDDFPDCAHIGVEYFLKPRFEFQRYEGVL